VIPPNIRALLPETLPVSDIFLNYSWEITLNIKEALDEWTRYSVIKWFVCICHFEENLIKLIWGQPFLLFHPFSLIQRVLAHISIQLCGKNSLHGRSSILIYPSIYQRMFNDKTIFF
jgi:hypothetical protein